MTTTTIYDYREGLRPLIDAGKVTPCGPYVLIRAVFQEDAFKELHRVEVDARKAIAHEIVAVGENVTRTSPGQHAFIRSTAADRMSTTDRTERHWLVHQDDIMAVWDPRMDA